jgi:hypothetical protein
LKVRLQPVCTNRLLLAMPRSDYQALSENLRVVDVHAGDLLQAARAPIQQIWFPNDCLISLRAEVMPGTALEIALVGNEGATATPDRWLDAVSPVAAVVQLGGSAISIDANLFSRCVQSSAVLQHLVFQQLESQWMQAAQNAVCSHYHLLEARLARLLLRIRDRIGRNDFHLTHEIMAQALGVRRVGVTKAAMALQSRTLIRYTRGAISIIDGRGLAQLACDCYQADYQREKLIAEKSLDSAVCVR